MTIDLDRILADAKASIPMSPATTIALVEALIEWREAKEAETMARWGSIARLINAEAALLALITPAQETNNDAG